MKKLLAMVLAVMMLLGLTAVSVSATETFDVQLTLTNWGGQTIAVRINNVVAITERADGNLALYDFNTMSLDENFMPIDYVPNVTIIDGYFTMADQSMEPGTEGSTFEIVAGAEMDTVMLSMGGFGTISGGQFDGRAIWNFRTFWDKIPDGGIEGTRIDPSAFLVGATPQDITVTLNGSPLSFDVPPIIQDGRTFVPLRAIFEVMGAEIEWNGDTQTVTATRADTVVIMRVGNSVISVDGEEITLDVAPQIVNDRTLVPARAVAESFGASVDWDNETQTVIITE